MPTDGRYMVGVLADHYICNRCGRETFAPAVFLGEANDPQVIGGGAMEFSTCLALERFPGIIWDTNCYYRDLGVHPRATKAEIRKAYQEKDGLNNIRLTMIVKNLLDDDVRRRYDATPIGYAFYDRELEDIHRAARAAEVSSRVAQGGAFKPFIAGAVTADEYDELSDETMLDSTTRSGQNGRATSKTPWGFYVWQSKCADEYRLARWRGHLASALRENGVTATLSVGFLGCSDEPWRVQTVGYRRVVFLNDREQPSAELASQAAALIAQSLNH